MINLYYNERSYLNEFLSLNRKISNPLCPEFPTNSMPWALSYYINSLSGGLRIPSLITYDKQKIKWRYLRQPLLLHVKDSIPILFRKENFFSSPLFRKLFRFLIFPSFLSIFPLFLNGHYLTPEGIAFLLPHHASFFNLINS